MKRMNIISSEARSDSRAISVRLKHGYVIRKFFALFSCVLRCPNVRFLVPACYAPSKDRQNRVLTGLCFIFLFIRARGLVRVRVCACARVCVGCVGCVVIGAYRYKVINAFGTDNCAVL